MSKHRSEADAYAETQLIPKFPNQATDEPAEVLEVQGDLPKARPARARHRAPAPAEPPAEAPAPESAAAEESDGADGPDGGSESGGKAVTAPAAKAAPASAAAPVAPAAKAADAAVDEADKPDAADGAEPSVVRRPRIHVPPGFLAPEAVAGSATPSSATPNPATPNAATPRAALPKAVTPKALPKASAAEAAAPPAPPATAAEETLVTPAILAPRAPIPVPPEFLEPPKSAPAPAAEPAPAPVSSMKTRPAAASPLAAPDTAEPAEKPAPPKPPAAKPDSGSHSDSPEWRERVPFDETGVLMRPELLRHRAMSAETELISAIKVNGGKDDGSEAAQAQRPGFWTGAWPRRALLAAILLLQAILSLRNNNTAFEDEALYLYSGHLELGHLLYGTPTGADFWSYFSGAPTLYPVLGAIADQIGGLFTARLLALAFMIGTTGLLYLMTRRLFGTRAALYAAGLYCCTEGTIFVGALATYDAPALFLLALSAWLVVRFAESSWPLYLLAAFPAALAVGTKYAALMFVPVIIVLALLASLPKFGWIAWIRPVALTIAVSLLIWTELKIAGSAALTGVQSTTTARAQGTDPISLVLKDSVEWSGAVFAIAVLGGLYLIRLPTGHRHAALPTARWQRVCLALLMVGSGLLAPAYQMHLHTTVSLQKHVAFGLFFAAPLAGYGLVRAVGPNFHRVQLGIAVAVITFALGMQQSLAEFHVWPNSNALMAEIVKYQQPNAHYLVSSDEVTIYGLRGDPEAEPAQFSNTFFFGYTDAKGQYVSGNQAYTEAVSEGYFRVIAYTGNDSPVVEQMIAEELYRNPNYELVAKIPEAESTGTTYYYIWVHK
jgi:hypothetical protein